jgi:hypothetical protein
MFPDVVVAIIASKQVVALRVVIGVSAGRLRHNRQSATMSEPDMKG